MYKQGKRQNVQFYLFFQNPNRYFNFKMMHSIYHSRPSWDSLFHLYWRCRPSGRMIEVVQIIFVGAHVIFQVSFGCCLSHSVKRLGLLAAIIYAQFRKETFLLPIADSNFGHDIKIMRTTTAKRPKMEDIWAVQFPTLVLPSNFWL